MTGRLIIRRPKQFADMMRRYRLYVGDFEIGPIKRGDEITVDLPAGQYPAVAKIDWCSSNPLTVNILQNETTEIEVGSNISGWKMLAGLLFITAFSDQYLYLRLCPRGFAVG